MAKSFEQQREVKLIRQAAAGDRAAAGRLIELHQGSVYSYILRLSGKPDVAEDVVQEAFVRVITNLDRFDPRFRFSTWLFTIARRVFLNMCEKRRPVSDTERMTEVTGRTCAVSSGWEEEEERDTSRDVVQQALMTLSIEQREVLVLFHQHEWPIWLIAEQLEMPEGTVKSHLHRGRTRLRDAVVRSGCLSHWNPDHRDDAKEPISADDSRDEQMRVQQKPARPRPAPGQQLPSQEVWS